MKSALLEAIHSKNNSQTAHYAFIQKHNAELTTTEKLEILEAPFAAYLFGLPIVDAWKNEFLTNSTCLNKLFEIAISPEMNIPQNNFEAINPLKTHIKYLLTIKKNRLDTISPQITESQLLILATFNNFSQTAKKLLAQNPIISLNNINIAFDLAIKNANIEILILLMKERSAHITLDRKMRFLSSLDSFFRQNSPEDASKLLLTFMLLDDPNVKEVLFPEKGRNSNAFNDLETLFKRNNNFLCLSTLYEMRGSGVNTQEWKKYFCDQINLLTKPHSNLNANR